MLNARYGIDRDAMTLAQVGKVLDVTPERVRQIERDAVDIVWRYYYLGQEPPTIPWVIKETVMDESEQRTLDHMTDASTYWGIGARDVKTRITELERRRTIKVTQDASEFASQHIGIEITLRGARRYALRLQFAAALVRLASFISPIDVVILEDGRRPWVFCCPFCERRSNGHTSNARGLFIVSCHYCRRQLLAMDAGEEPYIVHAEDFNPVCGNHCEYTEPFGFVPEAGCPRHDPED